MVADYTGCLQRKRDLEVAFHTPGSGCDAKPEQQGNWQGISAAPKSTAAASPASVHLTLTNVPWSWKVSTGFTWPMSHSLMVLSMSQYMQVRVGVLEREKAELDDRVGALETQLAATDKLAAQDFATKVWIRGSRILL
jgi:hypothetical protein